MCNMLKHSENQNHGCLQHLQLSNYSEWWRNFPMLFMHSTSSTHWYIFRSLKLIIWPSENMEQNPACIFENLLLIFAGICIFWNFAPHFCRVWFFSTIKVKYLHNHACKRTGEHIFMFVLQRRAQWAIWRSVFIPEAKNPSVLSLWEWIMSAFKNTQFHIKASRSP
jgi:hypothetical protein